MPTSYEGRAISNIYEREEIVVRIDAFVKFIEGLYCFLFDKIVTMFLKSQLIILQFTISMEKALKRNFISLHCLCFLVRHFVYLGHPNNISVVLLLTYLLLTDVMAWVPHIALPRLFSSFCGSMRHTSPHQLSGTSVLGLSARCRSIAAFDIPCFFFPVVSRTMFFLATFLAPRGQHVRTKKAFFASTTS